METLTIKSRKTKETFHFSMSDSGGYVWLESTFLNRLGGRQQICEGGGFRGNTVMANPLGFYDACKKWYRAYIRAL